MSWFGEHIYFEMPLKSSKWKHQVGSKVEGLYSEKGLGLEDKNL